ncbi:MAG: SDR family NAD(P)-dependent oxidoreductase, partial [Cyclobacteriaceae bacterium]|nr:SDR family NAD(P)-dependent oxidoreductase [Cyclobacteriaceae bacterium]
MNYTLSATFTQKRVFITGAGSGLGKALSLALARDGWTIGISDFNQLLLEETRQGIHALGASAYAYALDVSDREKYQQVARQFLADAGGIDVLINNAGIGDGGNFE